MKVLDEDVLKDVLTNIVRNANEELYACKQEDLERYWFYRRDSSKPNEWNLYKFSDCLELYKKKCRQWEEHHNGGCCVVERVRDQYLMPKIKDFLAE